MAKKEKTAETSEKKKKGIVQRMMFGDDTKPDLTPERSKMSKWDLFKHLFFHRFGTMVFLNLLMVLFALPAIAVIALFYINSSVAESFIPYSANLGIGYPVVTNAVELGRLSDFSYNVTKYLALVPCIAVFALGVAGDLYVIRKLMWEEPTRTFKDFFRGIKKCWLGALFMGTAFGFTLLLLMFSLDYFDAYGLSVSLKALSVTLSIILFIFIILFTSFFMTQNAAFKMRPMVLIRNSVLFIVGTHIQSIFFVGLALIPVYLMFIPNITMFLLIIYAFVGFSFTTVVVSVYGHYCYEKFLYDKISGKPSTVYVKRPNDIEEGGTAVKKKPPAPYKNPKKGKKSIDEGSSITPLTPTFRREDLERLQKEHEQIMREEQSEREQTDDIPPQQDDPDGKTE